MDIRARVEALNAQRLRAWEQGKAVLDHAASEGRLMSAEERQEYDRINQEMLELDEEVRRLVARADHEKVDGEIRELTLATFGEAGVQRRAGQEADHFRAWLTAPRGSELYASEFAVDIQRVAKERQMVRQGASPDEIRAMAWDATSGSLVVPTNMARSLYDKLEAGIAAFRIGASRANTSDGANFQMPTLSAHGIGTQVSSQGVAIGGTDPTFSRVDLNAYRYGQLVRVSNQFVRDAAFDLADWLGGDIGYALARVINTDLVLGTGTNEPTGYTILAGAGTNAPIKTGGSLIAPTVEKYIDAQYTIPDTARANAVWLIHDSTAGTIRKLRDGAGGTVGAFLWEPSLTNGIQGGQPDRFLGSPVYADLNCGSAGSNATLATYGDPSEYVIRTVGNPSIERSDERYFDTDEVGFRGKWEVGGNHRNKGLLAQIVQNV